MKTLKFNHLLIAGCLLLSSCMTIQYMGDTYQPTTAVNVYYDAKDIKQDYKVIGHLTVPADVAGSDYIKNSFVEKAKAIGADGIIILQSTGNKDHEVSRADAIKYK